MKSHPSLMKAFIARWRITPNVPSISGKHSEVRWMPLLDVRRACIGRPLHYPALLRRSTGELFGKRRQIGCGTGGVLPIEDMSGARINHQSRPTDETHECFLVLSR